MSENVPMTQADYLRQIADARKMMEELAKLFPGCFHPDGRAIVASAHFPQLPKATTGKEPDHA